MDIHERLFVSDAKEGAILRLRPSGYLSMEAEGFEEPRDFVFDKQGNLYVADTRADTVYRLDKSGQSTVLATGLTSVCCVALDVDESVLVLHTSGSGSTYTITRLTTDGRQTELTTGFVNARGMTVDHDGNIVVAADGFSDTGANGGSTEIGAGLFEVDSTGSVTRLVDLGSITPSGLTLSSQGTLVFAGVAGTDGEVFITERGTFEPLATGLASPHGLAANRRYVFVADEKAGQVWRVPIAQDSSTSAQAGSLGSTGSNTSITGAGENRGALESSDEGVDPVVARQFQEIWGYHGKPDYSKIPVTTEGVPRAPAGVTCVIGHVVDDYYWGLPNVTVRLGRKAIRTNSSGYWMLVGVPAGHQVYMIDGRSADYEDNHYPIALVEWELYPNQPNVLPYEAYLPVLDTAHTTKIDPNHETVHTTPLIPGLEIHIPAHTTITSVDGLPVTEITTTRVPSNKPLYPMGLVEDLGNHFTLQPGGAVSSTQVRVVFNNPAKFIAGTRVQLWEYAPMTHGGWYQYGLGTVTKNAKQIEPDLRAGFTTFGCDVSGYNNATGTGNGGTGGEPVDLATGVFQMTGTDLVIPGLMPLVLRRTYRNQDQNTRSLGVGCLTDFDWQLYGNPNGQPGGYIQLSIGSDTSYLFYFATNSPQNIYTCTNDFRFTGAKLYQIRGAAYPSDDGWNYYAVMKNGMRYDFDGAGDLCAIRDPNNNTLTIDRGGHFHGPVFSVTQPSGRFISFSHNNNNLITSATDSSGRSVGYVYDSSNRLVAVTNAVGGVTQYAYDGSNNMTSITLPNNVQFLQSFYDSNNRVTNQFLADGGTFSFSYKTNLTGFVTQTVVHNPLNNASTYNFDAIGFQTNTVDALGNITQFFRDGSNTLVKVIDSLGRTNSFVYDAADNVIAITNAKNKVTTFTYEPNFNRLTSVTDPLGHTTSFGHDGEGNLTSFTNASGKVTMIANNQLGQLISMTDPLGNTTTFTYNGSADLATVTDPLGNTVQRLVDAAGRPYAVIDPLGRVTTISYDALNRVTGLVDSLNGTTSFGYDSVGNLTNVTDALGHSVNYGYDVMDQRTNRTDQLGNTDWYFYNLNGNITNHLNRRGISITRLYDTLNRCTDTVYGTESSVQTLYDLVGRRTNVVDSIAGSTQFSYDLLNRLTQITSTNGTITYGYNDAGLRTNMTVVGQNPVSYTYDNVNRLTGVARGSFTSSLTYDDCGRRTELILPNGLQELYAYDAASRLLAIAYQGSVTNSVAYAYDAAGKRVSQASALAVYYLPAAVSTSQYDVANHVLMFGGYTMLYDTSGNVTNIMNGAGVSQLAWNTRNQLTNVTGAITASFTYDGLGRRVARTISGTTENYLYDGLDIIQQLDGSGAVGANYFRSLGIDEPWLRSDLGATITNSVYLVDALGSIVALTDTNGAIQTEYAYDPFGVTTNFGASSKNSHQFTGRENDGTGLYYYRARYYIPALGRFISEDPIGFAGGQINIYGYVGNDPIESTDPSGQWLTGTLPVGIGSGIGEAGGTIGAGEILGPIAGGIISGVFAGEAIVGALPGETTGPANDVTSVTSAYPPAQYPDPTSDPTSGPDYGQAPQRYKNNNAAPGSPASPGSPGPNDPNDPGDPNDPISKCKSTRDVSILACIAQYRIDGDLGDLYECCKEATRVYNECLVDNGVGGDAP